MTYNEIVRIRATKNRLDIVFAQADENGEARFGYSAEASASIGFFDRDAVEVGASQSSVGFRSAADSRIRADLYTQAAEAAAAIEEMDSKIEGIDILRLALAAAMLLGVYDVEQVERDGEVVGVVGEKKRERAL